MSQCVYGLFDPDTREVRYVGVTGRSNATNRLKAHIRCARKAIEIGGGRKDEWIASLLLSGKNPIMTILENEGVTLDNRHEYERKWFEWYSITGHDLLNAPHCVGVPWMKYLRSDGAP